jgi:hypothetical protein
MFEFLTGLTRTKVVPPERTTRADRGAQHFVGIPNSDNIRVILGLEDGKRRHCRVASQAKHPKTSAMGEFEMHEISLNSLPKPMNSKAVASHLRVMKKHNGTR